MSIANVRSNHSDLLFTVTNNNDVEAINNIAEVVSQLSNLHFSRGEQRLTTPDRRQDVVIMSIR